MTLHSTEGVKYAGSKRLLIPHILGLAAKTGARSVLDGFSGSTRVAQAFAKNGYRVEANDIAEWSRVFGTCYLLNTREPGSYSELLAHLNAVPPEDGWFTEHYGGDPEHPTDQVKKPWQKKNTLRLDGIRNEITRLQLGEVENAVALTSLMLALDRVDNTLGHFVSYLREWAPRSFGDLVLREPAIFPRQAEHRVHQSDIFNIAPRADVELAYYDPPYGSNNEKMPPSRVRYAAYYHLWTTVCLHDKPQLFGAVGRRGDSRDICASSIFESFRRDEGGRYSAVAAIARLLQSTRAPWVLLSYSSGGRASAEELHEVISQAGTLHDIRRIEHSRHVMSAMTWTDDWSRTISQPHTEYLFLLER